MTDETPPRPGSGRDLLLNSPLSEAALTALLRRATEHRPGVVVDHGCGWGEVLLRSLALAPSATGVGVDQHAPDLERARRAARERGLEDRVELVEGSCAEHRRPADLLLSTGAYQAFGDIPAALAVLREDLRPGGRALFGAEYWRSAPTDAELAEMWPGASVADCLDLPTLVDHVHAAGWRVQDLHDSTQTEFDTFELGHLRERDEWLARHPGHPETGAVDAAWRAWLRGRRRAMGFVTLVLA